MYLTSYWFMKWGTFEGSEIYKIDPRWSVGLIYNQFGIIHTNKPFFFATRYKNPALGTYLKIHMRLSKGFDPIMVYSSVNVL